MFKKLMTVAVCGVMLGSAISANALTTEDQMNLAKLAMASKGYSVSGHSEDHDTLRAGDRDTIRYTFISGKRYAIVGFCDNDCSDLDLKLTDSNGNLVDDDFEDDSTPVLGFTPTSSGDYKLEVIMRKCSSAPCVYRVQAFRKD